MPSLIQTSQVSRGWHTLCEEQSLWRNLFESQGWEYDRAAMDKYIANVPEEKDYYASSSSNGNNGNGSSNGGKIQPLPIARTSSPLIGKSKWSKLYAINRTSKNASPPATTKHQQYQRRIDHYDPFTDTRFINWKTLYQNRFAIENRWQSGSCKTRMFPPKNVPESDLHGEGIYCIQFDKDKMVTGSRDRTVKVWDMETGRCRLTMTGHTASVLCLQYDAHSVVSGSSDANLLVTDMETGKIKQKLEGHKDSVLSLRLVKEDRIISCSKDRSLRLWNKETGECIRILRGHRAAVNAVQWKDHRVVSASGDRTIKVWDLDNGKCLNTLIGHTRGVACVEFDGKHIVSGSSDQTIKVWNAETGESIFTLFGHTELVRTIQLDPIAKRIISGCYNGHLKIWSLDKGNLIRDLGQATEGR
jgi:F-box and WD-40 domain protein 1/11